MSRGAVGQEDDVSEAHSGGYATGGYGIGHAPSGPGPAVARRDLPSVAPEVAQTLLRVGCASARQVGMLRPGWLSERRLREVMAAMHAHGLLERRRPVLEYSPHNRHLLERPQRAGGPDLRGARFEQVYALSEEGLRFMAVYGESRLASVRARYRRSYTEAKLRHSFLNAESLAILTSAVAAGAAGALEIRQAETEGGTGSAELPRRRPGESIRRWEPDGWVSFEDLEAPADSARTDVFFEADTGTQNSMSQIAAKVNDYANLLDAYLEIRARRREIPGAFPPEGDVPKDYAGRFSVSGLDADYFGERLPPVVFVSPTERRSDAVKRFVERALRDRRSWARALHGRLLREGTAGGLLDLVGVTNLQMLRAGDGWNDAYLYLADGAPGPLL